MCQIQFTISTNDADGDSLQAVNMQYRPISGGNWILEEYLGITNVTNGMLLLTPELSAVGEYEFQIRVQDSKDEWSAWFSDSDNPTFKIGGCTPIKSLPPIAEAGRNITITLPTNGVMLSGSGQPDTNRTIESYVWSKVTPLAGTITSLNTASTGITNMAVGEHRYRLTVEDDLGEIGTDEVVVTVIGISQATTANAGNDIRIQLPNNSVRLDGSGTVDPRRTIDSYSWRKVTGLTATITSPNAASTQVTGLSVGAHVFELTVTDDLNVSATDEVSVTVTSRDIIINPDDSTGECDPAQDCCFPDGNGGFRFSVGDEPCV